MSKNRIHDLDHWFQYAEKIGQERLYNFLWAASILLLACVTILASDTAPNRLAVILSAIGIFMSILWFLLGRRQSKFHSKIEQELRKALEKHKVPEQFAIYHILQMKDSRKDQPRDVQLNRVEWELSTRRFLWFVPLLFTVAFAVTLFFGIDC